MLSKPVNVARLRLDGPVTSSMSPAGAFFYRLGNVIQTLVLAALLVCSFFFWPLGILFLILVLAAKRQNRWERERHRERVEDARYAAMLARVGSPE